MKRSIRNIVSLCVAITVGLTATGCAFTQWTDRYIFGTAGGPPVYENRKVTGAVILPFAVAGDIISAPVQIVLLAIMGDDWLYSKRTRGTFVSANDEKLGALDPQQREKLIAELDRMIDAAAAEGRTNVAFGISADGQVIELHLTQAQSRELSARAERYEQGAQYAVFSGGALHTAAR